MAKPKVIQLELDGTFCMTLEVEPPVEVTPEVEAIPTQVEELFTPIINDDIPF